jgi:hypothetical protein
MAGFKNLERGKNHFHGFSSDSHSWGTSRDITWGNGVSPVGKAAMNCGDAQCYCPDGRHKHLGNISCSHGSCDDCINRACHNACNRGGKVRKPSKKHSRKTMW